MCVIVREWREDLRWNWSFGDHAVSSGIGQGVGCSNGFRDVGFSSLKEPLKLLQCSLHLADALCRALCLVCALPNVFPRLAPSRQQFAADCFNAEIAYPNLRQIVSQLR